MSTMAKESTGEKSIRIRRGRVDSVDLYEIKDSELDLLEKGSPAGLYLNFAIFLLSIAFSALATICTTTSFKSALMQIVFVVVLVLGIILGVLLLILWYLGRKNVGEVIKIIRNRIPPEIPDVLPLEFKSGIPSEELPQPTEPKV